MDLYARENCCHLVTVLLKRCRRRDGRFVGREVPETLNLFCGETMRRPTTSEAAYRVIDEVVWRRYSVNALIDRGYHFLHRVYLPSLELLDQTLPLGRHKRLRFEGWYLAGDTLFCTECYSRAAWAYRRGVRFTLRYQALMHLEAAQAYLSQGQPAAAVAEWETAQLVAPAAANQDSQTAFLFEELSHQLEEQDPPLHDNADCRLAPELPVPELPAPELPESVFKESDISESDWSCEVLGDALGNKGQLQKRVNEFLAAGKIRQAARTVADQQGIEPSLCRARIEGVKGNASAVLRLWEEAFRTGLVTLESADWFHLPRRLLNSPRLWDLLAKYADRISQGSIKWGWPDALYKLTEEEFRDLEPSERAQRRCELWLAFHQARTAGDLDTAVELMQRYPSWPQARQLAMKLSASAA